MMELYRDGWSLAEIADRYGITKGSVHKYLQRAGVILRPPGRRPQTTRIEL
jgi:DNA-directed RNA polymerase specialized sigma24 family protein